MEVFETGARYQMYHAIALLAVAWVASLAVKSRPRFSKRLAALVAGTVLPGSFPRDGAVRRACAGCDNADLVACFIAGRGLSHFAAGKQA
jgi:hypothetical protein